MLAGLYSLEVIDLCTVYESTSLEAVSFLITVRFWELLRLLLFNEAESCLALDAETGVFCLVGWWWWWWVPDFPVPDVQSPWHELRNTMLRLGVGVFFPGFISINNHVKAEVINKNETFMPISFPCQQMPIAHIWYSWMICHVSKFSHLKACV